MAKILVLCSTVDGHTLAICKRLGEIATQNGHRVTLKKVEDVAFIDLDDFDTIVIGASIRYGKHRRNVRDFMVSQRQRLQAMPHAFFSVSAVARKSTRNTPDTNPYLKRFLSEIGWRPANLAVFAGKIDYPKYSLFERELIRLIMWMTKGPTDRHAVVDFTDWEAVDAYGATLSAL